MTSKDETRAGEPVRSFVAERLGENVRKMRTKRGWSLSMAQERLSVSRKYLVDLEHGRREPSIQTIARLANRFGITIGELTRGCSEGERKDAQTAKED